MYPDEEKERGDWKTEREQTDNITERKSRQGKREGNKEMEEKIIRQMIRKRLFSQRKQFERSKITL